MITACGGGGDAAPVVDTGPAPIEVLLFAGQSNMLGADATITVDRVHDLAEAGQQTQADRASLVVVGGAASKAWGEIRGHEGVSFGETTIAGMPVKVHGPEVGFARRLGSAVIVKYADNYHALEGGRSAWVKPGTRWTAWQGFVDRELAALGRPYRVVGVVWFQGIDDGILRRDKAAYKADLQQLIADVRARFGQVPVVIGRSVDSQVAGSDAMAPIRAAQAEVGSEPGNAWANVDGLPLVNVHHLTAAGQLEAGKRFAEAFLRLR